MESTTVSMDLKVDQVRTKKVKLNKFTVWGGICFIQINNNWYKYNFGCYSILSLFFWSPSHGGSLTLYSSLWTILTRHLLIIWTFIWVPIPSDTFFDFLWVVVAKTALFRGLLHINVARKVAAVHLMWW